MHYGDPQRRTVLAKTLHNYMRIGYVDFTVAFDFSFFWGGVTFSYLFLEFFISIIFSFDCVWV